VERNVRRIFINKKKFIFERQCRPVRRIFSQTWRQDVPKDLTLGHLWVPFRPKPMDEFRENNFSLFSFCFLFFFFLFPFNEFSQTWRQDVPKDLTLGHLWVHFRPKPVDEFRENNLFSFVFF